MKNVARVRLAKQNVRAARAVRARLSVDIRQLWCGAKSDGATLAPPLPFAGRERVSARIRKLRGVSPAQTAACRHGGTPARCGRGTLPAGYLRQSKIG